MKISKIKYIFVIFMSTFGVFTCGAVPRSMPPPSSRYGSHIQDVQELIRPFSITFRRASFSFHDLLTFQVFEVLMPYKMFPGSGAFFEGGKSPCQAAATTAWRVFKDFL